MKNKKTKKLQSKSKKKNQEELTYWARFCRMAVNPLGAIRSKRRPKCLPTGTQGPQRSRSPGRQFSCPAQSLG